MVLEVGGEKTIGQSLACIRDGRHHHRDRRRQRPRRHHRAALADHLERARAGRVRGQPRRCTRISRASSRSSSIKPVMDRCSRSTMRRKRFGISKAAGTSARSACRSTLEAPRRRVVHRSGRAVSRGLSRADGSASPHLRAQGAGASHCRIRFSPLDAGRKTRPLFDQRNGNTGNYGVFADLWPNRPQTCPQLVWTSRARR